MKVRLASNLQSDSIVDGDGIRTVIWFQGCKHHCKECQNPETWNFDSGMDVDIEAIKEQLKKLKYQTGITLSGGDPFFQASAAAEIAKFAHSIGLNVWTYTGFTYDEIINANDEKMELLKNTDALVDGRFEIDKKSLACKFRGSTNQRVIDVKKSLEEGGVVTIYD